MMKILWTVFIVAATVIIGISGYERFIAKPVGKEVTIEKDSAKVLLVKARFGAGDLTIQGGSKEWMNASFDYKNKKFLPHVTYKNTRESGVITIEEQSSFFKFNRSKNNNHWTIQLTNDIPINLDVDMGVSNAKLDLKDIQLNKLIIDGGVGNPTIDLSGERENVYQADIDIGIGDMTIMLPTQTGVKLTINKGIGKIDMTDFIALGDSVFVNEAYEENETSIDIKLDIGIGNVKLVLVE